MPDQSKPDPLEDLHRMGITMEPDVPGPYHREIAYSTDVPNTKTGQRHTLTCGHRVMTFGNVAHARGKLFCAACKDEGVAE